MFIPVVATIARAVLLCLFVIPAICGLVGLWPMPAWVLFILGVVTGGGTVRLMDDINYLLKLRRMN